MQKVQEVHAFLELEKREKETLRSKVKEQNATIHQLTHHLKLLQSNPATTGATSSLTASHQAMASANLGMHSNGLQSYIGVVANNPGHSNGMVEVHSVPLCPWDETALPTMQLSSSHHPVSSFGSSHNTASMMRASFPNNIASTPLLHASQPVMKATMQPTLVSRSLHIPPPSHHHANNIMH